MRPIATPYTDTDPSNFMVARASESDRNFTINLVGVSLLNVPASDVYSARTSKGNNKDTAIKYRQAK
ncbi:MAG: hypothetical protein ACE5FH_03520 [Candidatus Zixiibacteriota bacterium]